MPGHATLPTEGRGTPFIARAPAVGGTLGEYELVRLLGRGGVGAVYEAVAPDGARVAIKVLLDAYQDIDEVRARFERESALAAGLESPHLARTLAAAVDSATGAPFFVMPLMVGSDVDGRLDQLGELHPTVAVRIVRQACRGLEAAHASEVVHRDVKPANIFLDQRPDGAIDVRVLDLGIAKWRDVAADLTTTGASIGTPHYMAPEQVGDSKRVSPQSDVWSLGVTLYEMLSGSQPFGEFEEIADIWLAVASMEIPHLQSRAPWVDPGLCAIVHGTLLRAREERCPDVAALAEALAPFNGGSDELHTNMFEPLSAAVRSTVAPKAELPSRWMKVAPPTDVPTVTLSDDDPLLGETIDERFTILRCLGRGGMGSVYEAAAPSGERVAVKIIRPELAGTSRTARRRFVREAEVLRSLESEHIVSVSDVGADPTHVVPFIVMELLPGRDLEATLRKHGPLRPRVVARLFAQAARGLSVAHAAGVVHRDVKPANLFIAQQAGDTVCLKLCDFGVAKRVGGEGDAATLTRAGALLGSPMYMSPEQARNRPNIDARSDVWSLGATMYEALSGTPPWQGKGGSSPEGIAEVVVAVCSDPLPPLSDRAPWVPPELVAIVERAMHKDPDDRYATVDEMLHELEEAAEGSEVMAVDIAGVRTDDKVVAAADAVSDVAPDVLPTHAGTSHTVEAPPRRTSVVGIAAAALVGVGVLAVVLIGEAPESSPTVTAAPAARPPPTASATASAVSTPDPEVANPPPSVSATTSKPPPAPRRVAASPRRLVAPSVPPASATPSPPPEPPPVAPPPVAPPPPPKKGMKAREDW